MSTVVLPDASKLMTISCQVPETSDSARKQAASKSHCTFKLQMRQSFKNIAMSLFCPGMESTIQSLSPEVKPVVAIVHQDDF